MAPETAAMIVRYLLASFLDTVHSDEMVTVLNPVWLKLYFDYGGLNVKAGQNKFPLSPACISYVLYSRMNHEQHIYHR